LKDFIVKTCENVSWRYVTCQNIIIFNDEVDDVVDVIFLLLISRKVAFIITVIAISG
jgi:hypothetical protein